MFRTFVSQDSSSRRHILCQTTQRVSFVVHFVVVRLVDNAVTIFFFAVCPRTSLVLQGVLDLSAEIFVDDTLLDDAEVVVVCLYI